MEPTTPNSAATEHANDDNTGPRGSDATERAATHHSFEVRWLSGEIAYRYEEKKDLCLERLMQDFDEGLIKDVPSAHIDENGRWLNHYRLYWGTVEMVEGQWLSDYNMPPNTTLTLALVPVINV